MQQKERIKLIEFKTFKNIFLIEKKRDSNIRGDCEVLNRTKKIIINVIRKRLGDYEVLNRTILMVEVWFCKNEHLEKVRTSRLQQTLPEHLQL